MPDVNNVNDKGLNEKALENLQRNAQLRLRRKMDRNSLLISKDGEEVKRIFDPEQIEPQEIDYEGNGDKVRKFDYVVTDPNSGMIQTFRVSTKTSGDIDALLAEGYHRLKVRREGSGKNTRYYITPVKEP
jgi:hypothetical protein